MTEPLLAAAEPTFDLWYFVGLLSRVAHTTCAATLLGGLIYLRFVLAPAAGEEGEVEPKLFGAGRRAWAGCVGACTGLLLVSGFYNFFAFMAAYDNLPKLYHPLFGVKFLLALAVMAIMALVAGKTKLAERVRGSLKLWLNLALAASLGVYVCGAMLRSFRDLPDAREAVAVAEEAPAFEGDSIEIAE